MPRSPTPPPRRAAGPSPTLTPTLAAALVGCAVLGVPAVRAPLVAQSAPAAAAQPAADGVLSGTVRGPGGTVVVGAQVVVTPVAARGAPPVATRVIATDDDGRFRIPGLPTGAVTVSVRRIGYRPVTLEASVPADHALDVTLTAVPQQLAAVVVRERRRQYRGPLADFNRRRDLGFGRFITQADIDRRNPMVTTDLLRMIPGLNVIPNGPTNVLRLRSARCDPLIWIDGMPALSGYLDVDAFPPSTLAGIEVYNGVATVPVELRGTRGEESCGVIALWSRLPDPPPRRNKKAITAEDLARLVESATVFTAEQVDRPARLDSTATLSVAYPDSLREAHTPGEATVEFVVDTTGRVEPETVGVVAATRPEFAAAARAAATDARFIAAERQGRRVRQLVQLPLRWEGGR